MQKPNKTFSKYHNGFSMAKTTVPSMQQNQSDTEKEMFHKAKQLCRLLTSNYMSPWCNP